MKEKKAVNKVDIKNILIGFLMGIVPFLILKIISKGGIITFMMIFSFFGVPRISGFFYLYGVYIFGLIGALLGLIYSLIPKEKKKVYFRLMLIILVIYLLSIFVSIIISLLLGSEPINILK